VITDGLKPDDSVLVGGIQQVRPGIQIQTESREMPTMAPQPLKEETTNQKSENSKSKAQNPNSKSEK
jgi:hypothetical protein